MGIRANEIVRFSKNKEDKPTQQRTQTYVIFRQVQAQQLTTDCFRSVRCSKVEIVHSILMEKYQYSKVDQNRAGRVICPASLLDSSYDRDGDDAHDQACDYRLPREARYRGEH